MPYQWHSHMRWNGALVAIFMSVLNITQLLGAVDDNEQYWLVTTPLVIQLGDVKTAVTANAFAKLCEEVAVQLPQIPNVRHVVEALATWREVEREKHIMRFGWLPLCALMAREQGLKYAVRLQVSTAPEWARYERGLAFYQSTRAQRSTHMPSHFSNATFTVWRELLNAMREQLGEQLDMLTIDVPFPAPRVHSSDEQQQVIKLPYEFWCGDPYARDAFREFFQRRYVTIDALNQSWGTAYAGWDEIQYPMERESDGEASSPAGERRHWYDFIDWYYRTQARFLTRIVQMARRAFPTTKLAIALYGEPPPLMGHWLTRVVRDVTIDQDVLVRVKVTEVLPIMSLIASAMEFYNVAGVSELQLPTLKRPQFVGATTAEPLDGLERTMGARLFALAILHPVQVALSLNEMNQWDELHRRWGTTLPFEANITDVALLWATSALTFEPTAWYEFVTTANAIRDIAPYAVLDERMICDGALDDYRVLIAPVGSIMERNVLSRIFEWVKRGGILVIGDERVWCDLSGVTEIGQQLMGALADTARDVARKVATHLSTEGRKGTTEALSPAIEISAEMYHNIAQRIGTGAVVWLPIAHTHPKVFAIVVRDVIFNLSGYAPTTRKGVSPFRDRNIINLLAESDGAFVARCGNKLVLYNASNDLLNIQWQLKGRQLKRTLLPGSVVVLPVR